MLEINNTIHVLKEQHISCIHLFNDGLLCMHVLFDLTTKTTTEYLRTYVVNFSGITHTSLTNNYSISPIRLNLLIVVRVPAKDHNYII
jgi:hypothetical protein